MRSSLLLRMFSLTKTAGNHQFRRRWISTTTSLADKINVNHQSSSLPSKISPWLMLDHNNHHDRTTYSFFNFSEYRTITLPKTTTSPGGETHPDPLYVGSSHGWLAWVTSRANRRIYLTNPVSGRQIRLPKLRNSDRALIEKIVLSSSPDGHDYYDPTAVMIHGENRSLVFCRPGIDEEWAPLEDSDDAYQLVYSSKDQLFYSLHQTFNPCVCMNVATWDFIDDCLVPKKTIIKHMIPSPDEKFGLKEKSEVRTHLVIEPSSGDLLVVQRYVDHNKTVSFRVFNFDSDAQVVEELGRDALVDCVLFVGKNHGFALKASEIPGFVPNSIYFTDYDAKRASEFMIDSENRDVGIFDYRDKSIFGYQDYYYPCAHMMKFLKTRPTPIWITPNPC